MADKVLWAFQPLDELNDEVGFVSCDEDTAKVLIDAGLAQDPHIGALEMHPITDVKPKRSAPKKKAAAKKDS